MTRKTAPSEVSLVLPLPEDAQRVVRRLVGLWDELRALATEAEGVAKDIGPVLRAAEQTLGLPKVIRHAKKPGRKRKRKPRA